MLHRYTQMRAVTLQMALSEMEETLLYDSEERKVIKQFRLVYDLESANNSALQNSRVTLLHGVWVEGAMD